jgi:hypothetical protein
VEAVVVADSHGAAIAMAIERLDAMTTAGTAFLRGPRPDLLDWESAELADSGVIDMRVNR